jgi:hypothetical protein
MGTKQKAGIKGALDGVSLVVTAQPSAPSASSPVSPTPTSTAPAAGGGGTAQTASSK